MQPRGELRQGGRGHAARHLVGLGGRARQELVVDHADRVVQPRLVLGEHGRDVPHRDDLVLRIPRHLDPGAESLVELGDGRVAIGDLAGEAPKVGDQRAALRGAPCVVQQRERARRVTQLLVVELRCSRDQRETMLDAALTLGERDVGVGERFPALGLAPEPLDRREHRAFARRVEKRVAVGLERFGRASRALEPARLAVSRSVATVAPHGVVREPGVCAARQLDVLELQREALEREHDVGRANAVDQRVDGDVERPPRILEYLLGHDDRPRNEPRSIGGRLHVPRARGQRSDRGVWIARRDQHRGRLQRGLHVVVTVLLVFEPSKQLVGLLVSTESTGGCGHVAKRGDAFRARCRGVETQRQHGEQAVVLARRRVDLGEPTQRVVVVRIPREQPQPGPRFRGQGIVAQMQVGQRAESGAAIARPGHLALGDVATSTGRARVALGGIEQLGVTRAVDRLRQHPGRRVALPEAREPVCRTQDARDHVVSGAERAGQHPSAVVCCGLNRVDVVGLARDAQPERGDVGVVGLEVGVFGDPAQRRLGEGVARAANGGFEERSLVAEHTAHVFEQNRRVATGREVQGRERGIGGTSIDRQRASNALDALGVVHRGHRALRVNPGVP